MRIEVIQVALDQFGRCSRIGRKCGAFGQVIQMQVPIVRYNRRVVRQKPEMRVALGIRSRAGVARGSFVDDVGIVDGPDMANQWRLPRTSTLAKFNEEGKRKDRWLSVEG